jgi:CheY-like chemotaxis protein
MDGFVATREIRRLPGGGRTPILALTASAMSDDAARCTEAGMDDYLCKPVEPAALALALERWGRGREAAQPAPVSAPRL